jgi:hypothetical protein
MQDRGAMIGPLRTAARRPTTKAGPPIDHTHEMPAIERLERCGYTAGFVAEGGDTLRVSGTNRRYAAGDGRIRDFYRFEGTSNPDDMSVIYAVEMRDGTRGMIIDAFGTYADPATTSILDQMDFEPLAA